MDDERKPENEVNTEESRHAQLMKFMEAFQKNVEMKIDATNHKLENNIGEIKQDMKGIKEKMNENETTTTEVMKKMNQRLQHLEN